MENGNKDDSDNSSSIKSDLSDDFSEDNLENYNLDKEETLFKININNLDKKEKNKFLARKRISQKILYTNQEEANENNNNKYFDSILQDCDDDKFKEKENIK